VGALIEVTLLAANAENAISNFRSTNFPARASRPLSLSLFPVFFFVTFSIFYAFRISFFYILYRIALFFFVQLLFVVLYLRIG